MITADGPSWPPRLGAGGGRGPSAARGWPRGFGRRRCGRAERPRRGAAAGCAARAAACSRSASSSALIASRPGRTARCAGEGSRVPWRGRRRSRQSSEKARGSLRQAEGEHARHAPRRASAPCGRACRRGPPAGRPSWNGRADQHDEGVGGERVGERDRGAEADGGAHRARRAGAARGATRGASVATATPSTRIEYLPRLTAWGPTRLSMIRDTVLMKWYERRDHPEASRRRAGATGGCRACRRASTPRPVPRAR